MDFDDAPVSVRVGRWLFQHRSYQFVAMLPVLSFWWNADSPLLTWSLGISLMLVGGVFRLWCIGHIGRSARTRKDKAKRLITNGPFALCRNPIYLANIIGISGFVVVCKTLWFVPVYLLYAFTFYSFVVHYEEYLLDEKFGAEFQAYKDRTPRWIPRLSAQEIGPLRYDLSEIFYREKSMLWGGLGLLVVGVAKEVLPAVIH